MKTLHERRTKVASIGKRHIAAACIVGIAGCVAVVPQQLQQAKQLDGKSSQQKPESTSSAQSSASPSTEQATPTPIVAPTLVITFPTSTPSSSGVIRIVSPSPSASLEPTASPSPTPTPEPTPTPSPTIPPTLFFTSSTNSRVELLNPTRVIGTNKRGDYALKVGGIGVDRKGGSGEVRFQFFGLGPTDFPFYCGLECFYYGINYDDYAAAFRKNDQDGFDWVMPMPERPAQYDPGKVIYPPVFPYLFDYIINDYQVMYWFSDTGRVLNIPSWATPLGVTEIQLDERMDPGPQTTWSDEGSTGNHIGYCHVGVNTDDNQGVSGSSSPCIQSIIATSSAGLYLVSGNYITNSQTLEAPPITFWFWSYEGKFWREVGKKISPTLNSVDEVYEFENPFWRNRRYRIVQLVFDQKEKMFYAARPNYGGYILSRRSVSSIARWSESAMQE